MAVHVDDTFSQDETISSNGDNDAIFLATFGFLAAIGITISGLLLSLSGIFKLANLGAFLPFPVICGFFSAVGIMIWTLALSVDTGGITIGHILQSGDPQLVLFAIIHHVPSIIVASIMKYLGPKNPLFVVVVMLGTVASFYTILFLFGISFEEAKDMGWLWPRHELVYRQTTSTLPMGSPPAPFGVIIQLCRGYVHWGAVREGMSTAIALGFVYVIRCSVQGAAMKKNVANMSRTVKNTEVVEEKLVLSPQIARPVSLRSKSRMFSEAVDIEVAAPPPTTTTNGSSKKGSNPAIASGMKIIQAKPSNISLKIILTTYGNSQLISAIFGGFAISPAVAAATTMFSVSSVLPEEQ